MEQLTKVVGVRLTEGEYQQLQTIATEQDRSVGWVVREALRKELTAAQ